MNKTILRNQQDVELAEENVIEAYCLDCGGMGTRRQLLGLGASEEHIWVKYHCSMHRHRQARPPGHSCEVRIDRQQLRAGKLDVSVFCLQCEAHTHGSLAGNTKTRIDRVFFCPHEHSHRWRVLFNDRERGSITGGYRIV